MSVRVAFVAEGNAETRDCWSGCAQGFVQAMRGVGAEVEVFDAELRSWPRWKVAARSLQLQRRRWKAKFNFGEPAFSARSARVSGLLRESATSFDAIVQAGATFEIAPDVQPQAVRVVYADANVAFALAGRPFSGVTHLPADLVSAMARRERRVYDRADRIWTWSDALARSFGEDFEQDARKLTTIYAGANTDPGFRGDATASPSPRVLFVGKDHLRKGSQLLLEAFAQVHDQLPEAELHFVGCDPTGGVQVAGVVAHGFIAAGTPEGRQLLNRLYREATVFCLPSRYEPFGVSFVEAMLTGLPCIGTNRWAMPEIIAAGETGWLVPDGDRDALTSVLLEALSDTTRAAAYGAAGRVRALELFTWRRVAERAIADLASVLQSRAA